MANQVTIVRLPGTFWEKKNPLGKIANLDGQVIFIILKGPSLLIKCERYTNRILFTSPLLFQKKERRKVKPPKIHENTLFESRQRAKRMTNGRVSTIKVF